MILAITENVLTWDTLSEEDKKNTFTNLYLFFPQLIPEILCLYRDKYQFGLKEPVYYLFTKWSNKNVIAAKKFIRLYNPLQIGTYKDLIIWYNRCNSAIQGTIVEIIQAQIDEDLRMISFNNRPSLLGKWLPSINTSSDTTRRIARKLCKDLCLKPVQYRKLCTELRSKLDLPETLFSSGQITPEAVERCLAHISYNAKIRFKRKFIDELYIANINTNNYRLKDDYKFPFTGSADSELLMKLKNPRYIHL